MKSLARPIHNTHVVYSACVNGVFDPALKQALTRAVNNIMVADADYVNRALSDRLDLCIRNKVVFESVDSVIMSNLYTEQFVGTKGNARSVYDSLLNSAPGNICPYCLFGHVSSLDHVLPKSSYPSLAVTPSNLVPCCNDCNRAKGKRIVKLSSDQIIHPYFSQLPNDRWVSAEIHRGPPLVITFSVNPPATWSQTDKDKAIKHFSVFKLSQAYSIQASIEMVGMKKLISGIFLKSGADGVKTYLESQYDSVKDYHLNNWKTALYYALSNDIWFCSEGFSEII